MNVLIIGSNGFIGSNIKQFLKHKSDFIIFEHTRKDTLSSLQKKLKICDLVLHFAGENRSKNLNNFIKNNYELSEFIAKNAKKNSHIVYSSTIKIDEKNSYGLSKKKAEKVLKKYRTKNKFKLSILRLPNIFGRWSRPNYNSVVATFCHNIARNKKVYISNPNSNINLLYVDDLVVKLKEYTKIQSNKKMIDRIKANDKITLKQLYNKINSFQINRTKKIIGKISKGLNKNLYSTYISFLPQKKITYNIEKKNDSRGSFAEFYKNDDTGQVSFFIAKKGKIRGHHFHHSKVEKFLVVQGKAIFNMFDISTKKKLSFKLDDKNLKIVESIPGYQHYIKNVGNSDLIVLLWSNEIFDVKKPDTYKI